MTDISDIFTPSMAYKFTVTFTSQDQMVAKTLLNSVADCTVDLNQKTISLTLRDDPFGHVVSYLFNLSSRVPLTISLIGGHSDDVRYSMKVVATVLEHSFKLDYAYNDIAVHRVKLQIKDFVIATRQ